MHAGDAFFFAAAAAWQDMKKGLTTFLNTGWQEASFPMLEAFKPEPMPKDGRVLERKAVAAISLQGSDAKGHKKI